MNTTPEDENPMEAPNLEPEPEQVMSSHAKPVWVVELFGGPYDGSFEEFDTEAELLDRVYFIDAKQCHYYAMTHNNDDGHQLKYLGVYGYTLDEDNDIDVDIDDEDFGKASRYHGKKGK